jgi:acetyl esterase
MKFAEGISEYIDAAVSAVGPSGTKTGTPEERRLRFENYAAASRPPYPDGLAVRNWYVQDQGREIPIRIYRPAVEGPLPTLLYFHGGGWVMGSLDTHDGLTAGIAHAAGVQVIAVHYRRAPENPHPAAVIDCFRVLDWARGEGRLHGVDPERIGIAGDSAGGHLVASLTQMVKREGGPGLRYQIMLYPAIDPDFSTSSYEENAHSPFLTTDDMRYYWSQYMPDADMGDPISYPARAEDLTGLPPALIMNAQYDPLRDDGINYGRKLSTAGIPAEVRTVDGMIHGFLRARFVSRPAMEEFDVLCDRIRAHLS